MLQVCLRDPCRSTSFRFARVQPVRRDENLSIQPPEPFCNANAYANEESLHPGDRQSTGWLSFARLLGAFGCSCLAPRKRSTTRAPFPASLWPRRFSFRNPTVSAASLLCLFLLPCFRNRTFALAVLFCSCTSLLLYLFIRHATRGKPEHPRFREPAALRHFCGDHTCITNWPAV